MYSRHIEKFILNLLCTKKAWESIPLPVPHLKAFALPNPVERATQKPTPVCITHLRYTFINKVYLRLVNTHPWTSTVASFLTGLKVCEVFRCQEPSVK